MQVVLLLYVMGYSLLLRKGLEWQLKCVGFLLAEMWSFAWSLKQSHLWLNEGCMTEQITACQTCIVLQLVKGEKIWHLTCFCQC